MDRGRIANRILELGIRPSTKSTISRNQKTTKLHTLPNATTTLKKNTKTSPRSTIPPPKNNTTGKSTPLNLHLTPSKTTKKIHSNSKKSPITPKVPSLNPKKIPSPSISHPPVPKRAKSSTVKSPSATSRLARPWARASSAQFTKQSIKRPIPSSQSRKSPNKSSKAIT